MTLHIYFARRYFMMFLWVFLALLCISVLANSVEHLRSSSSGDSGYRFALTLALLNAPSSLYAFMPITAIIAAIALFLNLARSSELVVTRASGRSVLKSLVAPVLATITIGIIAVAIMNPIVATTSKQYEALTSKKNDAVTSTLSISREGLWLRQGSSLGQTVIFAEKANHDGTLLYGVTFFEFDENDALQRRLTTDVARLRGSAWILGNGKEWNLSRDSDNPEAAAKTFSMRELPSELTGAQILDSFGAPSNISVWDIPAFVKQLERAGFSATRHRVFFQMELALPLLMAAMVLIAAGFTMHHARFGHTGIMVLLAVLSGLSINFLRNFAEILGTKGDIPVMAAAWAPPIAAILLALGLLLHLEDG